MGFMDKAKDALGQNKGSVDKAVDQHGDQVIERGGDMVDDRTGGKHADRVDQGQDLARERLGTEGGKDAPTKDDQER